MTRRASQTRYTLFWHGKEVRAVYLPEGAHIALVRVTYCNKRGKRERRKRLVSPEA